MAHGCAFAAATGLGFQITTFCHRSQLLSRYRRRLVSCRLRLGRRGLLPSLFVLPAHGRSEDNPRTQNQVLSVVNLTTPWRCGCGRGSGGVSRGCGLPMARWGRPQPVAHDRAQHQTQHQVHHEGSTVP